MSCSGNLLSCAGSQAVSRSSGFGTIGAVLLAAVAAFLAATKQGGNAIVRAPAAGAAEAQADAKKTSGKPAALARGTAKHGGYLVAHLLDQYSVGTLSDALFDAADKRPALKFNLKSDENGVSADFAPGPIEEKEPAGGWQAGLKLDGISVRWLIQSVPDPLKTDLDLFTDAALDALLQGAAAAGYTLDRFDLPWELADGRTGRVQPKSGIHNSMGVVLFRKTVLTNEDVADQILVVLVVPETPTTGADTGAE